MVSDYEKGLALGRDNSSSFEHRETKYVKREWKNGRWRYWYNQQSGSSNNSYGTQYGQQRVNHPIHENPRTKKKREEAQAQKLSDEPELRNLKRYHDSLSNEPELRNVDRYTQTKKQQQTTISQLQNLPSTVKERYRVRLSIKKRQTGDK